MENIEIWKEIKGYEGLYEVSDLQRIKSLPKRIQRGKYNAFRNCNEKILKPSGKRYLMIMLSKNGVKNNILIHRLVAIAFVPNPYNKPQVNHKDGNKLNNSIENLEWCTNSENQLHAFKNNLQVKRCFTLKDREDLRKRSLGENNAMSKINSEIVLKIRESKLTHLETSKLYNISRQLVGLIKNNKRWTHI